MLWRRDVADDSRRNGSACLYMCRMKGLDYANPANPANQHAVSFFFLCFNTTSIYFQTKVKEKGLIFLVETGDHNGR